MSRGWQRIGSSGTTDVHGWPWPPAIRRFVCVFASLVKKRLNGDNGPILGSTYRGWRTVSVASSAASARASSRWPCARSASAACSSATPAPSAFRPRGRQPAAANANSPRHHAASAHRCSSASSLSASSQCSCRSTDYAAFLSVRNGYMYIYTSIFDSYNLN